MDAVRKAFTMLELMIVLLIIAGVAAIAVPAYIHTRPQRHQDQVAEPVVSDVSQLESGDFVYLVLTGERVQIIRFYSGGSLVSIRHSDEQGRLSLITVQIFEVTSEKPSLYDRTQEEQRIEEFE